MKSTGRLLVSCLLAFALSVGLLPTATAQTFTATLTGTVTDPQGATVPNVKVVATNQGTKLEYTAQTSDAGVYTIPFLPGGNYVISVEATGFKKLVSNEIKLEVNQTARVDLSLQVGAVSDVVNVEGVAPILQTENVTVGQVISGNTTVNLPLNGRNFQQLTLLVPGAITPNPRGFTDAGQGAQGRPYVNGNREQGNAFLLDGVSVDETIDNRIGYKPNVDAIAEFKIETGNSSSEFGNVTGATVITTLKSGTNDFRGNVFEFLRNSALDANSWTNNRARNTVTGRAPDKRAFKQNILGGTFGGPIVRERTFFFVDYQGTFNRSEGTTFRSVAPAAWRLGNLSTLSAFVRDPALPRTQLCQATPASPVAGVNYQEACFPGSIIPAARIVNPVARALFANTQLYPLANVTQASVANNYVTTDASRLNGHQFDVKIDHRATEKDNLSGRYSFGDYVTTPVRLALPTDISVASFSRPQNFVLNWTRTISATVINEARVGFNRATFISNLEDVNGLGQGNASLGIGGTLRDPGISAIRLGSGLSDLGSVGIIEDNVTNTFHYGDNLTIIAGRHQLKMGGQWQRYQQNRFYPGNNGLLGFFGYNTARFTGQAFADFLLDQVNAKGVGNAGGTNPGTWGHRQNRIGLFFQDDFKVRPNFTLNLGMRWEYTSPVVEVKDRQSNFELYSGRLLLAGQNGNSRALYEPFYKGFEPRIGFAWTPGGFDNRFVVRAGYGITQFMEGTGSNLRLPLNPPFFLEVERNFDPTSGPSNIATGFADVIPRPGTIAGQIRVWDPNLRPQFTQQYNLTLEYQLNNATSVSAAYVGHRATHLIAPTDWNQPLPDAGPPSTWRPLDARRPLAQFAGLTAVTQISGTASWAVSNYNSLQVSARQRAARGLEYLLSYTLSKTLTDNLGYYGSAGVRAQGAYSANHYDRRGYNYGPAFFDARHNFTWAGTYEVPFGKGRTFGSDLNPIVNAVLGGWGIGTIVQFRSGFPITVTAADQSLQGGRGSARPNLIGNPEVDNPTLDNQLNPAAFSLPAQGTFGSAGVGIARAPGYKNWDFSLSKKFYVTEARFFDFRAEFFNFTNTPSFAPPLANWSDPNTFGRITDTVSNPRNLEFVLKFHF